MINTQSFELEANRLREAYLESARQLLAPRLRSLGDEHVARILRDTMEQLPPMEQGAFAALSLQNAYEGFDWGSVLKVAAPIAQVAAPLVGTMVGGPVGGMIGGQVGNWIGGMATPPPAAPRLAAPRRPTPPLAAPRPAPSYPATPPVAAPQSAFPLPPAADPAPRTPVPEPNQAVSQLLALINNPQLIKALLGQALGNLGNSSVPVTLQNNTSETIPFGALMTTLSELAQQAAEASVRAGGEESERYLMDIEGYYRVDDPSNPEERANVVMALLREDYEWRNNLSETENDESVESGNYDSVTEWLVEAGMLS